MNEGLGPDTVRDNNKNYESSTDMLFRMSSDLLCVVSSTGYFLKLNPAWEKLLGYTLDELKSKPFIEFLHHDDVERTTAEYTEELKGKDVFNFVNRYICKDGSVKWLEWKGTASADRTSAIAVARDVTSRILHDDLLRQSEERFRTMFEQAPMGVALIDSLTGHIFEVNQKYADIIGRNKEEAINIPWMDITHPDDIQEDLDNMALMNAGKSRGFHMNKRYIHSNGTYIWISMTIAPVKVDDPAHPRHLCMIEDITDIKKAEDAARESEARFRRAFELPLIGVTITSPEKGWLEVNSELTRMLGYSKEELITKTWSELTHPDDLEKDVALFNKVVSGEIDSYSIEKRFICKNGEIMWTLMSAGCVRKSNGPVDYFVALINDITSRKNAENALKESEMKFRSLTENSKDMIMRFDRDYRHLYANPVSIEFFGISFEEFINKSHKELGFPNNHYNYWENRIQNVFNSGEIVIEQLELNLNDKIIHIDWNLIPEFDDEGNVVTVLSVAKDISEIMNAKKVLEESEDLFRKMFDDFSAIKLLIDPENGNLVDVNKAASDFYGYSKEQLRTMNVSDINPRPPEVVQRVIRQAASRKLNYYNFKHKLATGEIRDVEIYSSPIQKGNKKYLFANIHDITERKQAEKAIKESEEKLRVLNAEKDKFFSILAHDLRGPLGTFAQLTKLLKNELDTLTKEDILRIISNMALSSEHTYELLENLLEWSVLQRELSIANPVDLHLESVTKQIVGLAKATAEKKNIQINCSIPAGIKIYADERMLSSILRNFTTNAIKFTPNGGRITISAVLAENNQVKISVKDTGIGMSTELQKDLFNISVNTGRRGTDNEASGGLGLILCKEFAEKNNGRITVESQVGKGSIFSVILPASK